MRRRLLKVALAAFLALLLAGGGGVLWLFSPWVAPVRDLADLIPSDVELVARRAFLPGEPEALERNPFLRRLLDAGAVRSLLRADGGGTGLRAIPAIRRALEELERARAALPFDPVRAWLGSEGAVAVRRGKGPAEFLLLTRSTGLGAAACRLALSPLGGAALPAGFDREDAGAVAGFRTPGGVVYAALFHDALLAGNSARLLEDAIRAGRAGGAGTLEAARGVPPGDGSLVAILVAAKDRALREKAEHLAGHVRGELGRAARELLDLSGLTEVRLRLELGEAEARAALDLVWGPGRTTPLQDEILFGPAADLPGDVMDAVSFLPAGHFLLAAAGGHPVRWARLLYPYLDRDLRELHAASLELTRFGNVEGLFREWEAHVTDGLVTTLERVPPPAGYDREPWPGITLAMRGSGERVWPWLRRTVEEDWDPLGLRDPRWSEIGETRLLSADILGLEAEKVVRPGFGATTGLFLFTTARESLERAARGKEGSLEVETRAEEIGRLFGRGAGIDRRASLLILLDGPRLVPWLEDWVRAGQEDPDPPPDLQEEERARIEARLSQGGAPAPEEEVTREFREWRARWAAEARVRLAREWEPVLAAARVPGLLAVTLAPLRREPSPALRVRAVVRLPQ